MTFVAPNETTDCVICRRSDFETVSHRDRHGGALQTVVCRGCGLVRHADVPSDEALQDFYRTRYRESYHGETTPSNRRVMRAWNAAERIFGRLRGETSPEMRILEVGAGIGCTVKRFAQSGCQAWGVEPHRGFCDYGRRELGVPLQNKALQDIAVGGHELVLLVHVIEHFNNPLAALRRIAALLSDDGLLYIECPNLAAPFAKKSKMFHFAHVYNFTPTTLLGLAKRAGFALRKNYGGPRSANLEMLLERTSPSDESPLDAAGYGEAKQALRRATGLRYYARRDYWMNRAERLLGYGAEFVRAASLVSGLRPRRQSPANPKTTAVRANGVN